VVGTQAFFKSKKGDLDVLFANVAATPSPAHMTNAEPLGPLTACADYSYDSRSYVGDSRSYVGENHILVGDAAAFIDPLFSSGVMMAMSSAAFGATVVEGLLDGKESRERLVRDYEHKIRLSLGSLSWLIYRINSPLLRDIFMSSFDLFNTRHELIRILAGDFLPAARAALAAPAPVRLPVGFLQVRLSPGPLPCRALGLAQLAGLALGNPPHWLFEWHGSCYFCLTRLDADSLASMTVNCRVGEMDAVEKNMWTK
jgi:hypothetical protein